jgi:D-glycero-alpha-D-manno-heptose-7-phosphate kinase
MLVTSRTPLRVSLFGGGTDYPEYFERHPGAVLGLAIDQYIYISAVVLRGVQPYRYRVSYSQLEHVERREDIAHPVVREVLRRYAIDQPLDINVMSDIPANSGLGSSSAFTVGFLNLVHALKKESPTRFELACRAIHLEREVLQENVGVQDQLHAAFGGLNRFDFKGERIQITPLRISGQSLNILNEAMYLIYSGQKRKASDVSAQQMEATRKKTIDRELGHLVRLTEEATGLLERGAADRLLVELGAMLHEGWMTKRALSPMISNPTIDAIYDAARSHGALGGKLCGAGAGGFLFVLIPPGRVESLRATIRYPMIRISMDPNGTAISQS